MTTGPSLRAALAALGATAERAGVDVAEARAEGLALAATVAEPSRGAYLAWAAESGESGGAQAFSDAASRGRRFRVAPTPGMAWLVLTGSPHAAAYARALGEVAGAAAGLGDGSPRSVGNAATAAAAQLVPGTHGARAGSGGLDTPSLVPHERSVPPDHPEGGGVDGRGPAGEDAGGRGSAGEDAGGRGSAGEDAGGRVAAEERGGVSRPPEEAAPGEQTRSVEELLDELDGLVGLHEVKNEIHRQAAVLRIEGLRQQAGLATTTITRHLVFTGNPGTGKTTVARLVAGIYRALGLLTQGQLVEVDRSELVAGYLGQTAEKTAQVVASAAGGVLFIDEAYALAGDQYGREAVDTLVKEMEDRREDLVVIVAGYPAPMEEFIAQNPGLESRFRTTITFLDHSDEELVEIFARMAAGADYDADDAVLDRLRVALADVERDASFGNARFVRNLLEAAIGHHAWRLREVVEPTVEQLRTLEPADLAPDVVAHAEDDLSESRG